MVSLFKKNNFSALLLLLVYTLIVRLYSFIHPVSFELSDGSGILSQWIFVALADFPFTQSIIAYLLVYAQAVLINYEVNHNRLLLQQSALPSMFYVLFASFFIPQQGLTPELLGMTFVLLACFSAYRVYKTVNATGAIVNSAIYLGIATLLYPPFSILIIALFVEISVLRSFKIQERLQYILTLAAIYWIIGAFLFYSDTLSFDKIFAQFKMFGSIGLLRPTSIEHGLPLLLVFLAVAVQLVNYYNFMKKKGIESRKKIDFFFWVMLVSFLSLVVFRGIDSSFLCLLAFPLAVLTSMSFVKVKNVYRAELTHLVLLLLAIWCQYQTYLMAM